MDTHVNGEHFWLHFALDGGTDYHDVLSLDVCRGQVPFGKLLGKIGWCRNDSSSLSCSREYEQRNEPS